MILGGYLLWRLTTACPEQYDVFDGAEQVGYLRLRHGEFTVEYPDCLDGELLYTAHPRGDGMFEDNERYFYLVKAVQIIRAHHERGDQPWAKRSRTRKPKLPV